MIRYSNIPDRGPDWEAITEIDLSGGDYSEQLPGGGTFSVVGPSEPSEEISPNWAKRAEFEDHVFKSMGGNPGEISEDTEWEDFKKEGGLEDLFNHVFDGVLHFRSSNRMTEEQRTVWNDAVAREESVLKKRTREKKDRLTEQHEYMMKEFDSKAKEATAEKKAALKAEQVKKTKALVAAQKKREKANTVTLAEKKALQSQLKDYDPENNVFSVYDKKTGEWQSITKTALDIEILNETARLAGVGEFVPITRKRVGEEPFFGEAPIEESEEFFQMPVMKDDNIDEIVKSAQKVQIIAGEDPEAGKLLKDTFDAKIKDGLTPEGIASLIAKMQELTTGETGLPAKDGKDAGVMDISNLIEEFQRLQKSGDSKLKAIFSDKIDQLPEEKRIEFTAGLKKKGPEPRGSISMGGVTKRIRRPKKPVSVTAEIKVPETQAEERRRGFQQRRKQRVSRRARTLQQAQAT